MLSLVSQGDCGKKSQSSGSCHAGSGSGGPPPVGGGVARLGRCYAGAGQNLWIAMKAMNILFEINCKLNSRSIARSLARQILKPKSRRRCRLSN